MTTLFPVGIISAEVVVVFCGSDSSDCSPLRLLILLLLLLLLLLLVLCAAAVDVALPSTTSEVVLILRSRLHS